MRIRFIHESKDVTNDESNYHKDQIKRLIGTKINFGSCGITFTHNLLLTMVDGKVCNSATNTTSTMRCYICKATSKDFNKLEKFNETTSTELPNLGFDPHLISIRQKVSKKSIIPFKLQTREMLMSYEVDKDKENAEDSEHDSAEEE
ncbi:hypothetical protein HF086_006395 [Spodoptera exigua]|uniref:Uncharacterized protein n=1 Tax=Spodoptera exigua TaxID=7107 RepID=A0A922MX41_SPOEX|nr:hypothetical protein HF086_006395 [Spodoptera exigua]